MIRYKKKKKRLSTKKKDKEKPAQGFAINILILEANIHKDAIDTLRSYLGVAQLAQG